MIRVGVFGAGGRMGAEVCRAVAAAGDLELVAAVDPGMVGRSLSEVAGIASSLIIADDPHVMASAGVSVSVDFTHAASALANIAWCVANSVHAVVGTTGIAAEDLAGVPALIEERGGRCGVLYAPNFAIGAVMMMRFARMAAVWMPDAEVIELHHDTKRDSPSGTSLATVREILAGRAESSVAPSPGPAQPVEVLAGARGAEQGGVHVHSLRLPGLVAHQEVVFGGPGQTLSIRHDTTDRICFMPGVLLAVRQVASLPGLTTGLEHLLGL